MDRLRSCCRFLLLIVIPLLCVVTSVGSYWILSIDTHERFFFLFTLTCPLLFGLWFGRTWEGNHFKAYLVVGLLIGLLEMVGVIYIWQNRWIFTVYEGFWFPRGWSRVFWQVTLGATTLFTSGGLFADFVEGLTKRLKILDNSSPLPTLISTIGPPIIDLLPEN